MGDFETIQTFDDYLTANFAKQKLDENGINCYLADENTVAIQWILSNAVAGIKLRVPTDEKEKALEILNEKPEELTIEHTIETGDDLICPNCKSNNTRTERISKPSVALTWLLLGAPISINVNKSHRCFYCGHRWKRGT